MTTRLTLRLTDAQADAVGWLMDRKDRHDERHPRDTVGELLLDYAREMRGHEKHVENLKRGQHELRIELDAMRRERDGIAKALEAERTSRRQDRERHAGLRTSLSRALKTIERVRQSRDRYRDLVARAVAALLGTTPNDDLGSLERRLRLALRKAGFELPPRRASQAAAPAEEAQRRLTLRIAATASRRDPASLRAARFCRAAAKSHHCHTPVLRETSRDATRPLRAPVLAPTLGKGPGGRFPQRGGSLSVRNAHNVARIRATHAARLRNAARLTPAIHLLGCPPFRCARRVRGPRERGHRMVPPPFQTTGVRPTQGHQPTARLTNTGARRKAPGSRPWQATGNRGKSSGSRFRQGPGTAAVPADQNRSPPTGGPVVPLTRGIAREQCRRRPRGRNGCE